MPNRSLFTAGLLVVLISLGGIADAGERWLHVRVEEDNNRGERVSVNIPMSLVEAILPTIQTREFRNGRLRLDFDDHDFEGIDLRALFQALQDAEDTEFVTVESDDEDVRVAKENGFLKVDVTGRYRDERVRVRVPLAVVEALLTGDPYELNLMAALRALGEYDDGDLVTVESEDTSVRVWIDGNQHGN